MKSLDLLLQTSPSWVRIENKWMDGANVIASPPTVGNKTPRDFHLEMRPSKQRGVRVMEEKKHRQLPNFCLERHINPNSTFCLYFGSEAELTDQDSAVAWWSNLGDFLNNQDYAEKRGVWPLGAGLSHGDAAHEQIAMENLAEPLGWKDDLWRAMFRGKGWMAERLPRVSKTLDRVLNARTPCPRGCKWKHKLLRKESCKIEDCYSDCKKQHKPVLRVKCPNREVIEALVLHEHRRQKIEARIVDDLVQEGKRCCGTMKICPLRN